MTGGRARHQTYLQRTAIWIPVAVIALLMLPLVVTTRTFGDDWTKHLWMVREQELNIRANGRPGLFLSAPPLGAFYPIFAFVGSGLYSVGGYLALLLGDRPVVAYKLLYLCGLSLAYGGMTWLSCQVGLRGWRSQMPGLVLLTGTYFITDMFARGDLGELMGLCAIPFLIAAVTAVTISKRLRPGHLFAVVLAMFVLTGSHTITLLYGTIFLALMALVLLAAYAPSRLARLPRHRLPALLAAAAIGTGLNAWYLVADVRYGLDTSTAKQNRAVGVSTLFSEWNLLLNPLRPSDSSLADTTHDFRVALPLLFALWAIAVAIVAWRRIDRVSHRVIVLVTILSVAYVYLIVSPAPWRRLPSVLDNIQYAWRLHGYVLLATAVLVMVVLLSQAQAKGTLRRTSSALLAVIAVFTVGAATWQAWAVPSTYRSDAGDQTAPRNFADVVASDDHVRPVSWGGENDFRVLSKPLIDVGFAHRLTVPETKVRGSTYTGRLDVRSGPGPFRTNISSGPQFVTITGIRPIGFTTSGLVVAERIPGKPQVGPVEITIRQAHTTLLRAGAAISMLSLAALVALLGWIAITFFRPRFRGALRPVA